MTRILYVDDETALLEIGKLFLENTGDFTVETSPSAQDALEKLTDGAFDAIVSDFQMPGMDGIAFLREVRTTLGDLPFILFTGRGREEIVIEAIDSGADFYLQKGGDPSAQFAELAHKIKRAIERREAQVSLRASEGKFRTLVEQSFDGILILSADGDILFANTAAKKIVGADLPGARPLPKKVRELFIPESQENVLRDLERVRGGDDGFLVRYSISTLTGEKRWVECIGKLITIQDAPAVLISAKDITERLQAENALHESNAIFSTIFTMNPVALTLLDDKTRTFVDANNAFVAASGYSREDILGKTAAELQLFPKKEELDRFLHALHESGGIENHEMLCRRKSGELHTCRFNAGILSMGGNSYILSSFADISRQKEQDDIHRALVRSMVDTTGLDALKGVSDAIIAWTRADCVMIGEILPDNETVNVLSMLLDGREVPDFSYTLKGTPCEKVTTRGFCFYPDRATDLFPKSRDLQNLRIRGYAGTPLENARGEVIGVLCILSRSPLTPSPALKETLGIIAVKVAAELERIQMERALTRSHSALNNALDLAGMATWEYDITTDMFTFNDRFYALYGTTAANEGGYVMSTGEYSRRFLYPDDAHIMETEAQKIRGTPGREVTTGTEYRIIRHDGTIRSMVVRYTLTRDHDGKVVAVHGANQDVTGCQATQGALRQRSDTYQELVENANNIILKSDRAGKITFINEFARQFFGYTDAEILGRHMVGSIVPKTESGSGRDLAELIEQVVKCPEKFTHNENENIKKNGERVWVQWWNRQLFDADGTFSGMISIGTDITEQRKIAQKLKESEERYRNIVEDQTEFVCRFTPDNKLTFANGAFCRYFSLDPHNCTGADPLTSLPAKDRETVLAALARITPSNPVETVENRAILSDGSTRYQHWSTRGIFDEAGRLLEYQGVGRDITGRRQMESALRDAHEKLSLLTDITRHDIKNKLTALDGYLALARNAVGSLNATAADEYTQKAQGVVETIRGQIEFTRAYQDLRRQRPAWQDIDDSVMHAARELDFSRVTLVHDDVEGVLVSADPLFHKVFFNLFDNALHYGGEKLTAVTVSARVDGDMLLITCADNGAGVAADEKEKIFDRGYGKNTGLGLFLIKEILSITGMTIKETGTPGKGACFEITVPKGAWKIAGEPDASVRMDGQASAKKG